MPSPTVNITVTQTYALTQSLIDTFLDVDWFTWTKPVLNAEGYQTFDENGIPVMEPMTQEEYMANVTKWKMAFPVIQKVTNTCQELYGKLNYNAQEMNDFIMDNLTVSVVIE